MSDEESLFLCPIRNEIMRDPVIGPDGHSYEREAIVEWLQKHPESPLTREPMTVDDLKPNYALRNAIEHYLKSKPEAASESKVQQQIIDIKPSAAPEQKSNQALFKITHSTFQDQTCLTLQTSNDNPLEAVVIVVLDVSGSMSLDASDKPSAEGVKFSRLALVQHSIRTLIPLLQERSSVAGNSLGIISFSDKAKVLLPITRMTKKGAEEASKVVDQLQASGGTNIFDGIKTAVQQTQLAHLKDEQHSKNVHIVILTDGEPSAEYLPPRGISYELERLLLNKNFTISCFGFGYSLDSKLLEEISVMGGGSYSFVPDASMVGTVFVNYVAHVCSTVATNLKLHVGEQKIQIGSIQAKGARHVVLPSTQLSEWNQARLTYDEDKKVSSDDISFETSSEPCVDQVMLRKLAQEIHALIKSGSFKSVKTDGLKNLIRVIEELGEGAAERPIIKDILRDIESDKTYEGQLMKSCQSQEIFKSWGLNHLIQYVRSLDLEQCLNFKDLVMQHFAGELFKQIQDRGNEVFISLPAPTSQPTFDEPSFSVNKPASRSSFFGSASASAAPARARRVDMRQYYDRSGGCFSAFSQVQMENGSFQLAGSIKAGQKVAGGFEVKLVIKTNLLKPVKMVQFPSSSLLITPWHPIRVPSGEWQFPASFPEATLSSQSLDCYYNFVLDQGHFIIIDQFEVCTLGHGFEDNDVISHPYFGSSRCVEDLQNLNPEGYKLGYIELEATNWTRNEENGLIDGIKQ